MPYPIKAHPAPAGNHPARTVKPHRSFSGNNVRKPALLNRVVCCVPYIRPARSPPYPHLQRRGAVPSVVSHALGNRPDMNIAVICVPAFPSVAMGMRGRRCSIPASRQGNKPPHLFLSERSINSLLCKATAKSHDPKNAATFGALERPHPAPSSNRRDSFQYPRDIAVAALALGIHGAAPLVASPQH